MAAATLQQPLVRSSSPSSFAATSNNPNELNRLSFVSTGDSLVSSSAASFRTAPTPLAAASHNSLSATQKHSSASSISVHTLSPSPGAENINPLHHLAATMNTTTLQVTSKEIHVVKVTPDAVHIDTAEANKESRIAYPPSPPASDEGQESMLPPTTPTTPQVLFDEPEPITPPRERQGSTSSSRIAVSRAGTLPANAILQRSSTDARVPFQTRPIDGIGASTSKQAGHVSVDGYLHPPVPSISISVPRDSGEYGPPSSTSSVRPTRRNTTGSFRPHHPPYPSTSHIHFSTTGDGELASDIQMAAEQIRRERASKRVKAQQKAEEEMSREREERERSERSRERDREREDAPLVGNLIGKDHVNYVLMYNMLTGIRIGVSRCQAKIKRPLTDDDFTARHKFSFDIVGNELTPSTTYDFKFKDYAPWVFRTLREDHFHLDPADYLLSLTSKYILSELGSPGKSGSFFYFSRDYRFIIKTIRKEESTFLRKFLKQYYEHVRTNPHTLISRFYGLHRVKLPRGKKIHFVIMNNLFPPHRDIHETYDLKGSTVGRYYPEEKLKENPRAVLKDVNWIRRGRQLELGPEKRALLTEQLRRDKEFLKQVNVMDYSLLVGIHDVKRGNTEGLRGETLKAFAPDLPTPRRSLHTPKGVQNPEAIAMRRAMRSSDPKRLGKGKGTIKLPDKDTGDTQREGFLFYQDEGGLRATDENNEVLGTGGEVMCDEDRDRDRDVDGNGKIYYLGIIDILTPYGTRKKIEHFWKGLKDDRHKISPVPAAEYADRFFNFMKAIMRNGGGGEMFMTEKDKEHLKEKVE